MSNIHPAIDLFKERGLRDIQWKVQDSSPADALFYRLPDQRPETLELMRKRLSSSKHGLVFINSSKIEGVDKAVFLGEEEDAFLKARSALANFLYPVPAKKYVAITGTNGKTTTVDIIRQLLLSTESARVISIGTLGVYLNRDKIEDFSLTSPDYIDLRKILFKYADRFDICALEASSHAIDQKRLGDIVFNAIGWTSFSQDHLDYHKTMENYFEAKRALFKKSKSAFIVSSKAVNLRKALGGEAVPAPEAPALENDFFKSSFNQINLEVALGCLEVLGMKFSKDKLEALRPPPGRFNVIKKGNRYFVIDFAHTPDALKNICSELKRAFPDKKLVCVFGCGGNRDPKKRAPMGEAVAFFADHVVVTNDNPRFERPEDIIKDILLGLKGTSHEVVIDREKAIEAAVKKFESSVVLIAGKGHEPYLEVQGEKRPYSDKAALEKVLDL